MANPIDENQKAKSIPDYESVGAIWVAPDDLKKLKDPEDYRANDPVKYFNGVTSGKYKSESIDTPAFQSFNQALKQLTTNCTQENFEIY